MSGDTGLGSSSDALLNGGGLLSDAELDAALLDLNDGAAEGLSGAASSDVGPTIVASMDARDGADITISDLTYIYDASYVRQGADLLLIKPDGTAILIENYFAVETVPDLVGEGGRRVTGDLVDSFLMPEAPGQTAALTENQVAQAAGEPIGSVENLTGTVTAVRPDGTTVELSAGDPVFQGDQIVTSDGGSVKIAFIDETIFTLGSDARLALDEMVFNPATQSGESAFSILKGGFLFVSGQIAETNPNDMTVNTPVATIGIRGTIVTGEVAGVESATGETFRFTVVDGEIAVSAGGATVILSNNFATVSGELNEAGQTQIFEFVESPQNVVARNSSQFRALSADDVAAIEQAIEETIQEQTGESVDFDLENLIPPAPEDTGGETEESEEAPEDGEDGEEDTGEVAPTEGEQTEEDVAAAEEVVEEEIVEEEIVAEEELLTDEQIEEIEQIFDSADGELSDEELEQLEEEIAEVVFGGNDVGDDSGEDFEDFEDIDVGDEGDGSEEGEEFDDVEFGFGEFSGFEGDDTGTGDGFGDTDFASGGEDDTDTGFGNDDDDTFDDFTGGGTETDTSSTPLTIAIASGSVFSVSDGVATADLSSASRNIVLKAGDTTSQVTLSTGSGNDTITTGAQNDSLSTGSGNDEIETGAGNDTVNAGAGDDTIVGGHGEGDDLYDGGTGSDTVTYNSVTGSLTTALTVTLGSASETTNITDNGQGIVDNDTITGVEHITLGDGNDTVSVNGLGVSVDGDVGTDLLTFGSLTDSVSLDLSSGAGTSGTLSFNFTNFETFTMGAGDDTVKVASLTDSVVGGAGTDTIDLGNLSDGFTLTKDGVVTITNASGGTYSFDSFEAVSGSAGDDVFSMTAADVAIGGGGAGQDTLVLLTGGEQETPANTTTLTYANGGDIFGVETIDLSALSGSDAISLSVSADAIASGTNGGTLTILGDSSDNVIVTSDGWTDVTPSENTGTLQTFTANSGTLILTNSLAATAQSPFKVYEPIIEGGTIGDVNWNVAGAWNTAFSDSAVALPQNGDSVIVQARDPGNNNEQATINFADGSSLSLASLTGNNGIDIGELVTTGTVVSLGSMTTMEVTDFLSLTPQVAEDTISPQLEIDASGVFIAGSGGTVGELDIDGGHLIINSGSLIVTEDISFNNGDFIGTGTISGGTFELTNPTLSGTGTISGSGTIVNNGSSTNIASNAAQQDFVLNANMVNNGTLGLECDQTLSGTGTIFNTSGAEIDFDNVGSNGFTLGVDILNRSGGTIDLAGDEDHSVAPGSTIVLANSTITNQGTIDFLNIFDDVEFRGTGALAIEGDGLWVASANDFIAFLDHTTLSLGENVNYTYNSTSPEIVFLDEAVLAGQGTFNNTATLGLDTLYEGTTDITIAISSFRNTGLITNAGITIASGGTLTNESGGVLELLQTGSDSVFGVLDTMDGTLALAGSRSVLDIGSGGKLVIGEDTSYQGDTVSALTIDVKSGGALEIGAGDTLTLDSLAPNVRLDDGSTLEVSGVWQNTGSSTFFNGSDATAITGAGSIVNTGHLVLNEEVVGVSIANTQGTLQIGSSDLVTLNGNLSGGSIVLDSRAELAGTGSITDLTMLDLGSRAVVSHIGGISADTVELTSSQATVSGVLDLTNSNLSFTDSTAVLDTHAEAGGKLIIGQQTTFSGDTLSNLTIDINSGGTLEVASGSTVGLADLGPTLRVFNNNTFDLNGVWENTVVATLFNSSQVTTFNGSGSIVNTGELQLNEEIVNVSIVNATTSSGTVTSGLISLGSDDGLELNGGVTGGSIALGSDANLGGTGAITDLAHLELGGGSTVSNTGTVSTSTVALTDNEATITGALNLTDGTLVAGSEDVLTVSGRLIVGTDTELGTNATVDLASLGVLEVTANETFTYNGGGPVAPANIGVSTVIETDADAKIDGSGTFANTGTLDLTDGTIGANLTFDNNGVLLVEGNDQRRVTIETDNFDNSGGTIHLHQSANNVARLVLAGDTFTNTGTILMEAGGSSGATRIDDSTNLGQGTQTFINATNGVIQVLSGGTGGILFADTENQGTITLGDDFKVSANLDAEDGIINLGSGNTVTVQGGGNQRGNLIIGSNTDFQGTGVLKFADQSSLTVQSGESYTYSTSEPEIAFTGSNQTWSGDGTFTNTGSLTLGDDLTISIANFINDGTVGLGGELAAGTSFQNSGVLSVDSTGLNLAGSLNNSGVIDVAADGTITLASGGTTTLGGTIDLNGGSEIKGGTNDVLELTGVLLSNDANTQNEITADLVIGSTGTIVIGGSGSEDGTLVISGSLTNNGFIQVDPANNVSGVMLVEDDFTNDGTLQVDNAATLDVGSGSGTFTNAGILQGLAHAVDETGIIRAGTIINTGLFHMPGGEGSGNSTLTLEDLIFDGTAGSITIEDSTDLTFNGAELKIGTATVLEIGGDADIEFTGAGATLNLVDSGLGITNTGVFTLSSGAALGGSGTFVNHTDMTLDGVTIGSSATFDNDDSNEGGTSATLSAGETLTVDGRFINDEFSDFGIGSGGVVAGTGTLTNAGTMDTSGVTIASGATYEGDIDLLSSSQFVVDGAYKGDVKAGFEGAVSIGGAGAFEMTSGTISGSSIRLSSSVDVTQTGALTFNSSGGVISVVGSDWILGNGASFTDGNGTIGINAGSRLGVASGASFTYDSSAQAQINIAVAGDSELFGDGTFGIASGSSLTPDDDLTISVAQLSNAGTLSTDSNTISFTSASSVVNTGTIEANSTSDNAVLEFDGTHSVGGVIELNNNGDGSKLVSTNGSLTITGELISQDTSNLDNATESQLSGTIVNQGTVAVDHVLDIASGGILHTADGTLSVSERLESSGDVVFGNGTSLSGDGTIQIKSGGSLSVASGETFTLAASSDTVDPISFDPEITANATTSGTQELPKGVLLNNGSIAAIWEDAGYSTVRVFNSEGQSPSNETDVLGSQTNTNSDIVALSGGGFVALATIDDTRDVGGGFFTDVVVQGFTIFDNSGAVSVAFTETTEFYIPGFEEHTLTTAGTGFIIATREEGDAIKFERYNSSGLQSGLTGNVSGTVIDGNADGTVEATELGNGNIVFVYNSGSSLHTTIISSTGVELYSTEDAETEISTSQTGNFDVAAIDNDTFVVTWQNSGGDVIARHYQSSGSSLTATTTETVVNSSTFGTQFNPSVDVHTDGSYTIAYESNVDNGILVQRFDSSGEKIGTETTVASGGNEAHDKPSLVAYDNGDFAVFYEDGDDISLRIGDSSGGSAGPASTGIATNVLDSTGADPDLATLQNGNVVAVWEDGSGISGQVINTSTGATVQSFSIASSVGGGDTARDPVVETMSDGTFRVGYAFNTSGGGTVSKVGTTLFNADGTLNTAHQQHSFSGSGEVQEVAGIAALDNGGFGIAMHTGNQSNLSLFNSDGTIVGGVGPGGGAPIGAGGGAGDELIAVRVQTIGSDDYYQVLRYDGTVSSSIFVASAPTESVNGVADATFLTNGNYVVTYVIDDEPRFKIFDNSDQEVKAETVIEATMTAGDAISVEPATNGGFRVTWTADNGGDDDVFSQLFDSAGATNGAMQTITATSNNATVLGTAIFSDDSQVTIHEENGQIVLSTNSSSSSTTTPTIDLLDGSTIGGGGVLHNANDINASGTVSVASGTELENTGSFTQSSGSLVVSGVVENQAAGELTVEGATITVASGGSFSNAGTLSLEGHDASARLILNEAFTNSGRLVLDNETGTASTSGEISTSGGTHAITNTGVIVSQNTGGGNASHRIDANLTNTGTILVQDDLHFGPEEGSPTLTLDTSEGTIDVSTTQTLDINGILKVGSASVLDGDGIISFQPDATLLVADNQVYTHGTASVALDNTDGTMTIDGNGAFSNNGATIAIDDGDLVLSVSGVINTGLIQASTGAHLTVASNNLTNTNGTIAIVGGDESSALYVESNIALGGILSLGHNGSTVTTTDADIEVTSGKTLTITGTLQSTSDGSTSTNDHDIYGTFVNQGTFQVENDLHLNENGHLDTTEGRVSISTGAALEIDGGFVVGSATVLEGAGEVIFDAGRTLSVISEQTYTHGTASAQLTNTDGAFTIGGDGTFSNSGATIAIDDGDMILSAGSLINTGVFRVSDGADMTLATSDITNTGGTLEVVGGTDNSSLHVAQDVTVGGTIHLREDDSNADSDADIETDESATLTISGILKTSSDSTNATADHDIFGNYVNEGTFLLEHDLHLNSSGTLDSTDGQISIANNVHLDINGDLLIGSSTALTGQGTIIVNDDFTVVENNSFTHTGGVFLSVEGGELGGLGTFTNRGTIHFDTASGTETIAGSLSGASVENFGLIRIEDGTLVMESTSFSNSDEGVEGDTGTIRLEATTGTAAVQLDQNFENTGLIQLAGDSSSDHAVLTHVTDETLTNNGGGTIQVLAGGDGEGLNNNLPGGDGDRVFDVDIDNVGMIAIEADTTLTNGHDIDTAFGTISIQGGDGFLVNGDLIVGSSTNLDGSGSIDFGSLGALSLTTNHVYTNDGSGPTFDFSSGGTIKGDGTLENNGSLELSGAVIEAGLIDNDGTITVEDQALTLRGTSNLGNDDGLLNIFSGDESGGTLVIEGSETIGGRVVLDSSGTNDSSINVTSGTLTLSGTLTSDDSSLSNDDHELFGTIVHTGTIEVNQDLHVNGVLDARDAVISIATAETLEVAGSIVGGRDSRISGDGTLSFEDGGVLNLADGETFAFSPAILSVASVTNVATDISSAEDDTQIVRLSTGDYWVTYHDGATNRYMAQGFDSAGASQGSPITISSADSSNPPEYSVAVTSNDLAIFWFKDDNGGNPVVNQISLNSAGLKAPLSEFPTTDDGTGNGVFDIGTYESNGSAGIVGSYVADGKLTIHERASSGADNGSRDVESGFTTITHTQITGLQNGSTDILHAYVKDSVLIVRTYQHDLQDGSLTDTVGTIDTSDAVSVAALTGGGFAVSYIDDNLDGTIRVYDAAQTLVKSITLDNGDPVESPKVEALSDGSFAVIYEDASSGNLVAETYGATGGKLAASTTISTDHNSVVDYEIVADASGGFAVSYTTDDNGMNDVHLVLTNAQAASAFTADFSNEGTIAGTGTLLVTDGITQDLTGAVIAAGANVDNDGTITVEDSTLTVETTGFDNEDGTILVTRNTTDIAFEFTNSFTNDGVIKIDAGSGLATLLDNSAGGDGVFTNSGLLVYSGGDAFTTGQRGMFETDILNTGTITIDGFTRLQGGYDLDTTNGKLEVSPASGGDLDERLTIRQSAQLIVGDNTDLTGSGDIRLTREGSLTVADGQTFTYTDTDANFEFGNGASTSDDTVIGGTGTFRNQSTLALNDETTVSVSSLINDGGTITSDSAADADSIFLDGGTLTNTNGGVITTATMTGTGTFIQDTGENGFAVAGKTFSGGLTAINNGGMDLDDGTLTVDGSGTSFSIGATGTLAQGGVSSAFIALDNGAILTNAGLLKVADRNAITLSNTGDDGTLVNTGTIDFAAPESVIKVGSGSRFSLASGTTFQTAAGQLSLLAGAVLAFDHDFTYGDQFELSYGDEAGSAELAGTGTLTFVDTGDAVDGLDSFNLTMAKFINQDANNLALKGATISTTFQNDAAFEVNLDNNGTLTIASGHVLDNDGTLRVGEGAVVGGGTLDNSGLLRMQVSDSDVMDLTAVTFKNTGTISLETLDSSSNGTLIVADGFTNEGTISFLGGDGDDSMTMKIGSTGTGTMTNSGLITTTEMTQGHSLNDPFQITGNVVSAATGGTIEVTDFEVDGSQSGSIKITGNLTLNELSRTIIETGTSGTGALLTTDGTLTYGGTFEVRMDANRANGYTAVEAGTAAGELHRVDVLNDAGTADFSVNFLSKLVVPEIVEGQFELDVETADQVLATAGTLTGGSTAAEFVGSTGDDVIISSTNNQDVLFGREGNDRFTLTTQNARYVDGGSGTDVLYVSDENFGQGFSYKFNNFEALDVTGMSASGTMAITQDFAFGITEDTNALLNGLSGLGTLADDALVIAGNSGQTLQFTDDSNWTATGSTVSVDHDGSGSDSYAIYSADNGANVYVDTDMSVQLGGGIA